MNPRRLQSPTRSSMEGSAGPVDSPADVERRRIFRLMVEYNKRTSLKDII